MKSNRKHRPAFTMTTPRPARAALRALIAATLLPLLPACGAAEPPPNAPLAPNAAESERSGPRIEIEVVGPESARREFDRMMHVMRETKSQGCDSPPLLPLGSCDGTGSCETFPLLARSTTSNVSVGLESSGDLLSDSGVELTVDVVQCKPGPSVVMTYSQDLHKSVLEPAQFSVPTEPNGKYFLRVGTSKAVAGLQLNAGYRMVPDQPARPEGPCNDAAP